MGVNNDPTKEWLDAVDRSIHEWLDAVDHSIKKDIIEPKQKSLSKLLQWLKRKAP